MNILNKIKRAVLVAGANKSLLFSITVLTIVVIVVYHNWFLLNSVFFSGDATFRFDEYTKTLFTTYNTWLSEYNFGGANLQIHFFLSRVFWALLSQVNITSTAALKLSHFLPIAILSLISPYIFLRKLTKDDFISVIGGIFYGTTTYLFASISRGHLPIAFIYALSPLIFYLYIVAIEKNRFINWLIFTLIYWVGMCYEPRIMYILTFILIMYFLFFYVHVFKKYTLNIFLSLVFFLALNSFWLTPVIFGGIMKNIQDMATRGIFGSYLFSITESFTIFHFSWTGAKPTSFTVQQIPWFFWITPITLLILSISSKIKKNKKIIIFFWLISLIGIFISKQESRPLPGAFSWLFNDLPTFGLFRNGLKFYLVTALGYLGLIGCLLLSIKESKKKIYSKYLFMGFSIIILLTSLYNAKPLITEKIETIFVPRRIPADYSILKDSVYSQTEFFRTLWVPTNSRWGIYASQKPIISDASVIGSDWHGLLKTYNENEELIQNSIVNVFKLPFSNHLIDVSSVKYVIVPLQDKTNDDDLFVSYGGLANPKIRDWYISELDKVAWLKKIDIGTKDLVAYENAGHRPPLYAFDELYNLNTFDNLDKKYDFVTNKLNKEFYFTVDDNTHQSSHLTQVDGLFEKISAENIDKSVLKVAVEQKTGDNISDLYVKSDSGATYVAYKNNRITFYTQSEGSLFLNNSEVFKNTGKMNIIKSIPVSSNKKYYLLTDSQSFIINAGDVLDLGVSDRDRTVRLSTFAKNIMPNPSFENGLWQKIVGDCNRSDDNSIMAMSLNGQSKTDGQKALQLEATTHIACTAIRIPITESGEYYLSFDYQSPNSNKAGYYLNFDNHEKTVFGNSLSIVDDGWQTYVQKITVPEGSTAGTLFVYAYSKDNATSMVNRYDNFKLQKILKSENVVLPETIEFTKIPLALEKEGNIFEYKNETYDYNNIIPNPSFESGLWNDKVGDCHNFDNNPVIAMNLNHDEKSDGAQSLQLEATRHIACTSIDLPVKSGRNYLLSFDHQSPNDSAMSYYIGFNDGAKTVIKESVPINGAQWNTFTRSLIVPGGATRLTLYLYAKPTVETENVINRYDNFQLIENPNLSNVYYLVSEPKTELKVPAAVDFDLTNPAKKLVHIKGATTPFYLAMGESYHPQWQLQLNDEKIQGVLASWMPFVKPDRVKDEYHYKLNDFLNAWYVDPAELCNNNDACRQNPDGSYDMEMVVEFWPQRWFYLGLLISSTTLAGCLGYLAYAGIKGHRSSKKKNEELEKICP